MRIHDVCILYQQLVTHVLLIRDVYYAYERSMHTPRSSVWSLRTKKHEQIIIVETPEYELVHTTCSIISTTRVLASSMHT